ncbi:MAG: hypothetical protein WC763_05980 [Candidatus Paceibacterota bacterium]|jgi:hypothetical protein
MSTRSRYPGVASKGLHHSPPPSPSSSSSPNNDIIHATAKSLERTHIQRHHHPATSSLALPSSSSYNINVHDGGGNVTTRGGIKIWSRDRAKRTRNAPSKGRVVNGNKIFYAVDMGWTQTMSGTKLHPREHSAFDANDIQRVISDMRAVSVVADLVEENNAIVRYSTYRRPNDLARAIFMSRYASPEDHEARGKTSSNSTSLKHYWARLNGKIAFVCIYDPFAKRCIFYATTLIIARETEYNAKPHLKMITPINLQDMRHVANTEEFSQLDVIRAMKQKARAAAAAAATAS